jgi:hypothetical protein
MQGWIHHNIARFILWKYETHLESQGAKGYAFTRFDSIENPHLEHIAPSTEPNEVVAHGYDTYDEEFINEYKNCLGNYLLLSQSHNCSIGNIPFADKWRTYTHNEQQREVQRLVPVDGIWSREVIKARKDKIAKFMIENC